MPPSDGDRLARVEATLDFIKDQIASIVAMTSTVTQMQVEAKHHTDALGRVFGRVEELERRQDRHEAQDRDYHDELDDKIGSIEQRVAKYLWIGTGLAAGIASVWAVFAWVLKNDLVSILAAITRAGSAGN